MSSSQKYAEFVRERMHNKEVGTIAGVGERAVAVLNEKGFNKAYMLLGQFLVLSKDPTVFNAWLQTEITPMNSTNRDWCFNCLNEWCNKNL
jgi:hypothetical protein